jgi:hypothetical protein
MYKIHFFNAQGMYQVPIYRTDLNGMMEIVFSYKDLVPGIRVTEADEVVFETERGVVIWPEIPDDTLSKMAMTFPPVAKVSALCQFPAPWRVALSPLN